MPSNGKVRIYSDFIGINVKTMNVILSYIRSYLAPWSIFLTEMNFYEVPGFTRFQFQKVLALIPWRTRTEFLRTQFSPKNMFEQ